MSTINISYNSKIGEIVLYDSFRDRIIDPFTASPLLPSIIVMVECLFFSLPVTNYFQRFHLSPSWSLTWV